MNYHDKYLKYKNKYIQLKSELKQFGGDKAFIKNIDAINLFIDEKMERYLNPIYGMILCYAGFIPNNFYLYKDKFINTDKSKLINNAYLII